MALESESINFLVYREVSFHPKQKTYGLVVFQVDKKTQESMVGNLPVKIYATQSEILVVTKELFISFDNKPSYDITLYPLEGIIIGGFDIKVTLNNKLPLNDIKVFIGDKECIIKDTEAIGGVFDCNVQSSGRPTTSLEPVSFKIGTTLYKTKLMFQFNLPQITSFQISGETLTNPTIPTNSDKIEIDIHGTYLEKATEVKIMGGPSPIICSSPHFTTKVIHCTLPPLSSRFHLTLSVWFSKFQTNEIDLPISGPYITSIMPNHGPKKKKVIEVTITGGKFDPKTVKVLIGEVECPIIRDPLDTPGKIYCKRVPVEKSGKVIVHLHDTYSKRESIDGVEFTHVGLTCYGQPKDSKTMGQNDDVDWWLVKKMNKKEIGFRQYKDYGYMFFNDQPFKNEELGNKKKPGKKKGDDEEEMETKIKNYHTPYGHVKGILMWEPDPEDENLILGGIHISHSQSYFPNAMFKNIKQADQMVDSYVDPPESIDDPIDETLGSWFGKAPSGIGNHFFCYKFTNIEPVADYFLKSYAYVMPYPGGNPKDYAPRIKKEMKYQNLVDLGTVVTLRSKYRYGETRMKKIRDDCLANVHKFNLENICYWIYVPPTDKPTGFKVQYIIKVDQDIKKNQKQKQQSTQLSIPTTEYKYRIVKIEKKGKMIANDGLDIYDIAANHFKYSLFAHTWTNMQSKSFVHTTAIANVEISCMSNNNNFILQKFHSINRLFFIDVRGEEKVHSSLTRSNDHSKMAYPLFPQEHTNNKIVCVGDLNRHGGQGARGGGLVCFENIDLAYQLNRLVGGYSSVRSYQTIKDQTPVVTENQDYSFFVNGFHVLNKNPLRLEMGVYQQFVGGQLLMDPNGTSFDYVGQEIHTTGEPLFPKHLWAVKSQDTMFLCHIGYDDSSIICPLTNCGKKEQAIRSPTPFKSLPSKSPTREYSDSDQFGEPVTKQFFMETNNSFKTLRLVKYFKDLIKNLVDINLIKDRFIFIILGTKSKYDPIEKRIILSNIKTQQDPLPIYCQEQLSYLLTLNIADRKKSKHLFENDWANSVAIAISLHISKKFNKDNGPPLLTLPTCFNQIDIVSKEKEILAVLGLKDQNKQFPYEKLFSILLSTDSGEIGSLGQFYNEKLKEFKSEGNDKWLEEMEVLPHKTLEDKTPPVLAKSQRIPISTQDQTSPIDQLIGRVSQLAFDMDQVLELSDTDMDSLSNSLDKWINIGPTNLGIKVLLLDPQKQTNNQAIKFIDEIPEITEPRVELCYQELDDSEVRIEVCTPKSIILMTDILESFKFSPSTLFKKMGDLEFHFVSKPANYDGYIQDKDVDGLIIASINSKLCDLSMTSLDDFGGDMQTLCPQSGPIIVSVSAEHGPTGGGVELELRGTRFTEDLQVVVGYEKCTTTTFHSQSSISCIVPPNVGSKHLIQFQDVEIVQKSQFYYSYDNPVISSVQVATTISDRVTEIIIQGNNFGRLGTNDLEVYVDSTECATIEHLDTLVKCHIQSGFGQLNLVNITINRLTSTTFHLNTISNSQFSFPVPPTIESISQSSGRYGDIITIYGNFYNDESQNFTVYFGDTPVIGERDDGSHIQARVPRGNTHSSKDVRVTWEGIYSSETVPFKYDEAYIFSFSLETFNTIGGMIQIFGNGWGMSDKEVAIDFVKMDETLLKCRPLSTLIECVVPRGIGTYKEIKAQIGGEPVFSFFSPLISYKHPIILGMENLPPGGKIKIKGENFVPKGVQYDPQTTNIRIYDSNNDPINCTTSSFVDQNTIFCEHKLPAFYSFVESGVVSIGGQSSELYTHSYDCNGTISNGQQTLGIRYGYIDLDNYDWCTTSQCMSKYRITLPDTCSYSVVGSSIKVQYKYSITLDTFVDVDLDLIKTPLDLETEDLVVTITSQDLHFLGKTVTRRIRNEPIDCPPFSMVRIKSLDLDLVSVFNDFTVSFAPNQTTKSISIPLYQLSVYGTMKATIFNKTGQSGGTITLPVGRFNMPYGSNNTASSIHISDLRLSVALIDQSNNPTVIVDVYPNNPFPSLVPPYNTSITIHNLYGGPVPKVFNSTTQLECNYNNQTKQLTFTTPKITSTPPESKGAFRFTWGEKNLYATYPFTYQSITIKGKAFINGEMIDNLEDIEIGLKGTTLKTKTNSSGSYLLSIPFVPQPPLYISVTELPGKSIPKKIDHLISLVEGQLEATLNIEIQRLKCTFNNINFLELSQTTFTAKDTRGNSYFWNICGPSSICTKNLGGTLGIGACQNSTQFYRTGDLVDSTWAPNSEGQGVQLSYKTKVGGKENCLNGGRNSTIHITCGKSNSAQTVKEKDMCNYHMYMTSPLVCPVPECQIDILYSGQRLNLSPYHQKIWSKNVTLSGTPYMFYWTLCGANNQCPSGSTACQLTTTNQYIGIANTQATWKYVGNDLVGRYSEQSTTDPCKTGPRITKIYLTCGPIDSIISVTEPSTCLYEIRMTSIRACDQTSNCQFRGYDYSSLASTTLYPDRVTWKNFSVSICGEAPCRDQAAVCEYIQYQDRERWVSAGSLRYGIWSTNSNGVNQITYSSGSNEGCIKQRSTTIQIECGEKAIIKTITERSSCQYEIVVTSPVGCF
ncbi:hypothetical protein DFA_09727 [Cavenderia fasciculata]|uniref:MRH domain-containing protein n=1 Tax=Cavenderia fasciculata TaxID=261658 RepID=F4Q8F5_CACFS|nr:uncharacterized protein DFA_09727 [Cavenderia fasciculata]EGG16055.1 hypothetical protein DFA_09727 [Cavenderia fasciculata]|eukprot:XP_004352380.1 hypothetical protein DFA_09727 [Cavenderia fasciculata]